MQLKTLITPVLLMSIGLSPALQADVSPHSQRLSIDPPVRDTLPEDHPATSASERLAGRDGNTIRVGSDSDTCDYDNLSDALAAASDGDAILLENNDDLYLGDTYFLGGDGMTIRGGYDDCLDDSPSGRTTLNADGQGRVFDLWLPTGETDEMNVVLENLSIRGGLTDSNLGGAGIVVEGRQGLLSVELINVEVTDNTVTATSNGGGIRVVVNADAESSSPMLVIDNDSIIQGNSTEGNGGGLACDNPDEHAHDGTMIRVGAADIAGNSATHGGGLAFDNCRNVFIYNGGPILVIVPTGAIFGNEASEKGGGLYASGSSLVTIRGDQFFGMGDPDHAAHVVFNEAEFGAGIYNDGAMVTLEDVVINSNEASEHGGGIYATDGATTIQHRLQNAPCEPSESSDGLISVPRCSRMTGNSAADGAGGGYFVTNGAALEIDRTIITDNDSELAGSVVRATADNDDNPGVANFRNALVHGNSGATLFYGWQTSEINVAWSTITDNEAENNVFRSFASGDDSASIGVVSSIIWEDSASVLTTGGSGNHSTTADCLIAHEDADQTGFNSTVFYSNIDPMLTTVGDKPYFPANTSPAIDYCDAMNAEDDEVDLVGTERGSEHQGPDPVEPPDSIASGTYDIGAYETEWGPQTDELFQDRFEAE